MSVHLRVVLDTRKALKRPSSESGEDFYPVRLRVTYDRKRRYHKTSLPSLTQKDWEKVQLGVRMTQRQREVFHGIREIEARAHDIIQDLNPFSFAVFKARFFGNNTSASNNLIDMFKAHISKLEEEERISTASSYQCALNSLARTCDHLIMSHKHIKYFFSCEDTENIGILELHVIPNVCSEYSEQN